MASLPQRIINRYAGHPIKLLTESAKLLAAGHLCWTYFYSWAPCSGPSMLPTFDVWGEGAIVDRTKRRVHDLAVGDIVRFRVPTSADDVAIKRLAGLPGDYVLMGSPDRGVGKGEMIQVPPGHCWVLGDNLPASKDSRLYGPVPMALVDGKVIFKTGSYPWQLHSIEKSFSAASK